jgi:hypothetical protein
MSGTILKFPTDEPRAEPAPNCQNPLLLALWTRREWLLTGWSRGTRAPLPTQPTIRL